MNQRQQAVLLWSVLAFAARLQRVLTYGEIAGLTGIPAQGQADALFLIHKLCKKKRYPLLNQIAVAGSGERVGFPGEGEPTAKGVMHQDECHKYLVERARVFAFDWTRRPKPRERDFAALS